MSDLARSLSLKGASVGGGRRPVGGAVGGEVGVDVQAASRQATSAHAAQCLQAPLVPSALAWPGAVTSAVERGAHSWDANASPAGRSIRMRRAHAGPRPTAQPEEKGLPLPQFNQCNVVDSGSDRRPMFNKETVSATMMMFPLCRLWPVSLYSNP